RVPPRRWAAESWLATTSQDERLRALALLALLLQNAGDGPPLVGRGILHQAVRVQAFVPFGQVLRDRHALGRDEQQAVAVLVLLHLVTGADPAAELGLRGRIGIEV